MARIRGRAGYKPPTYNKTEVFQCLKALPLAPEFYPTLEEFQDPIAYIHKIEKEASLYGICKIIPPVSLPTKETTLLELNNSLLARSASPEGELKPTFTTRVQQVGFYPRKHDPVIKSVWESGETYTVSAFETKAKTFEKNYFKKRFMKKGFLSPLEIEALYWNAHVDKPIGVEYANDMPGSAFVELDKRRGREGVTENLNVGDTEWNLRGAARAKGCPLRFIRDDIPGVTSPMVYLGMMFSWFAWHVEDHDLHSLNYMHMGDGKTWYGVPKDAAVALEEMIRNHGYEGDINPLLTYATLGKKTTVISPEVLVNAGVPCCRLVQNAGEFVVTFPRAYHSGFSHGFNCAEASNIATPEWFKFAREAAIRRASINCPPLVSHNQLLYNLALSCPSRVPMSEPRSSRMKEKKKSEGDCLVKELFLQDVMENTNLLNSLGKGSPLVLLPPDFAYISFWPKENVQCERLPNTGLLTCVACGVICFACAAIVQPINFPMSSDCSNIGGMDVASEVSSNNWLTHSTRDANNAALDSSLGHMAARSRDCMFDVPRQCEDQIQTYEIGQPGFCSRPPKNTSALALLAMTYGDSADSETESRELSSVSGINSDDSRSFHISFPWVSPTESNNFDSPDGSFSPGMVIPHATANRSSVANHTESAAGSAFVPVQNRDILFASNSNEDSSRSHVFCLQHAFKVEQKLRELGGAHMLLLCHPDYPKLWMETELMADIPTAVHLWSNISFRTATKEDKEKIKSALSSEGSIHTNGDWAVRLKLNLFHSANLSRTSMYSKQIPYNSVLYNIFNRGSSADIPAISNPKQKKTVVVGKWCGKVWMSNQVHQLLAERDHEEQEQVNASQTFAEEQLPELRVMPENPSKRHTVELSSESSKSIGKRKIVANIEPASRGKSLKGKESVRATDHEQVKVSQTLAKQHPEPEVMPEKSSKSQTIDLSSESSRATLKRKSMTDIELTSRGKSLIAEESVSATDRAPKNKCIIQYKRRNKLKEKEIQEETPRHGKNSDQGAKQFDVPTKDMSEGGPSTRLRQRIAKQAAQNDLEVVMDKVVAKTAYKKQTCSKRAKRTLGIQASATKRTKKLEEDAEYPCKIEGCRMNLASRQELALHEKNICSVKGCRKKFVLHKYLLQHQKVHLDDRPLKCPWKGCTKTFKWAWSRIEHIRVHTGARPYTCGETGCGKTFRFVSDFSRHKRNTGHSGKLEESATKGKNKTN